MNVSIVLQTKGGDRMWNNSTNPDEDIETIIRDSGDMLFRICFLLLGNTYDTEYVIQYKPFLANDTKELFEEMKLSMKEERTKRYVKHFENEEELEIGDR